MELSQIENHLSQLEELARNKHDNIDELTIVLAILDAILETIQSLNKRLDFIDKSLHHKNPNIVLRD